MAKYADMVVSVTGNTDLSVRCVFHEDEPEEQELWVPHSLIEDVNAAIDPDLEDKDGNRTISVAKWFLIKNDIDYEHDPRDPDEANE